MTPMKAIRAKCIECCCGSVNEVRLCPSQDCPLWVYRFGHNPARLGLGNAKSLTQRGKNEADEREGERAE